MRVANFLDSSLLQIWETFVTKPRM